jgi:hypothetical protein
LGTDITTSEPVTGEEIGAIRALLLGSVGGGLSFLGTIAGDDVPDVPTLAQAGAFYVIDEAGTSQGKDWSVGDQAFYKGTSGQWDQIKSGRIVVVKDFGATGNGTDDDLVAIQAAVAAVTANGGAVYFPAGTYRHTDSILLPRRVTLFGDGLTSDFTTSFCAPTRLVGDGDFDKIVCDDECAVKSLQVDGADGNGGDGLLVIGGHVRIKGVTITNQGGDGLRVGGKETGCNANSGHFECLHIVHNTGRGIYVHDVDSGDINANACTFMNLDIRANGGDAICVEQAFDNNFFGVTSQVNGGAGIRLKSGAKGQQFWFPYLEANTGGTALLESGSVENFIFGFRQGTGDGMVDSGLRNTVVGRDFAKQGNLIWHELWVRQLCASKVGSAGVLKITQTADDAYELRNTNGNNSCSVTITADGVSPVGILNLDRIFAATNGLSVNANKFVGVGTANASTQFHFAALSTNSRLTIEGNGDDNTSADMMFVKNGLGRLYFLPYGEDDVAIAFDAWLASTDWKSADAGSNFKIQKQTDTLTFQFAAGVVVNSNITWADSLTIDKTGKVSLPVLPVYADNTAAGIGGLTAGQLYRTSTGVVMARF